LKDVCILGVDVLFFWFHLEGGVIVKTIFLVFVMFGVLVSVGSVFLVWSFVGMNVVVSSLVVGGGYLVLFGSMKLFFGMCGL